MRFLLFISFLIALASCSTDVVLNDSKTHSDSIVNRNLSDTIPVTQHHHYKNRVDSALKYFVAEEGTKGDNNFYIEDVVVDSAGQYFSAWVFYPKRNMLILFEPYIDGIFPAKELVLSRRKLDLVKDVVPTIADLHGSTYLITEEWKNERLKACKNGSHFLITK